MISSSTSSEKGDVTVHLGHLREVLQVMRENELCANLKKCVCVLCIRDSSRRVLRRQRSLRRPRDGASAVPAAEEGSKVDARASRCLRRSEEEPRIHLLRAQLFVIYTDHADLQTLDQESASVAAHGVLVVVLR